VKRLVTADRDSPLQFIPCAVEVGDFVFVSSLYPVDRLGIAVTADPGLQYVRDNSITVQSRHCLTSLQKVLERAGSSLEAVIKADVQLASASDFYDFKLVWKEYFPSEPPVRTTLEVGDVFPFSGALLSLDAVALASGSRYRLETLSSPDVPDPMPAEWAPWAVKAGPFVFSSGFCAIDFGSGLAVGKRPQHPYYGSDAEMQAHFLFDNLNRVLARAGTSLAMAIKAQLYEPDLDTFNDVDRVWGKYMAMPPTRSSMGVHGLLVPGATFVTSLTVLVPDADHQKVESRAGIAFHPIDVREVNFSPVLKVGDWRFFAGMVASPDMQAYHAAPSGLPHHYSDIEEQVHFTLGLLGNQLEANECDWQHVVLARVFLVAPRRDYRGFLRAWQQYFPAPTAGPALALVPTTGAMFPGPIVEIDLIGVAI